MICTKMLQRLKGQYLGYACALSAILWSLHMKLINDGNIAHKHKNSESARKCILHRWVWLDRLSSALVTTSSATLLMVLWWSLVLRSAHLNLNVNITWQESCVCYRATGRGFPLVVKKKVWLPQSSFNPLTAKLFNLNFHSLEVVSRWRDSQLQVSENYSDLTNGGQLFSNIAGWCHILSLTYLKCGT